MIKVIGCGDLLITKPLPEKGYKGLNDIIEIMDEYEVRFGNLETTVHDNEGYPSCFPGGGWIMANPARLYDVKRFGFNMLNIANNHSMDFSHKGLEATIKYLKRENLQFAGAGLNLAEAAMPVYVECENGRVAFISITSSFHDSDAAGPNGGVIPGRPGVNPLRHMEVYQLESDLYVQLGKIAEVTGINDTFKWSMNNGYMKTNDNLFLRNLTFKTGDENKKISTPSEIDLNRTLKGIMEAKIQADRVIVSIHSHQMKGDDETPDEFVTMFCHEVIDAGVDAVFGHGSHILRGLEIYNGKPIFYGLGDFIMQNEMIYAQPREFYDKYGVVTDAIEPVGVAMNSRSLNETRGLCANPLAWEGIMAGLSYEEDIVNIKIYPIDLCYGQGRTRRGWPHIGSDSIIKRFSEMSLKKYGTQIGIDNGIGVISLS
jgi:poly-gamma-glutamate synthesis protein (capsule biosynthesis protein)